MSRFTSTKVINSRWRNNDFIGAAGSSHTFPDAFHDEFLVDWAQQIADGSIIITETPTTGNIQMATLTVGDIVLTGTATGFPGAPTIVGTAPINVVTASSTSTISLNANYQTAGTYVTSISGTAPITASGTTAVTIGIDQTTITAAASTNASVLRAYVKNSTGTTLNKGQVVYISGSDGANALISLSTASTEVGSSKTLGLLAQTLTTGQQGYVIENGLLVDIDTSAATAGQSVWLGNTPGSFVFGSPPAEPSHSVYLGVVTRVQQNNGEILVKVQNGYEIDELHDVSAASPSDGDIIQYKTSSGLWTKQSLVDAGISTSGHTHSQYLADAGDTLTGQLTVSNTGSVRGFGSSATGASIFSTAVDADSQNRFGIRPDGELTWGSGSATRDTNLYRVSANALKTDDALEVVGSLTNGGTAVSLSGHTHATSSITSGNFVATLGAGTGVTVTGADANAAAKTVSIGQAVATSSSPTFAAATITGNIDAATFDKVTITSPATSATLTIANTKTFTASNTLTLTGTDSSSVDVGNGGSLVPAGTVQIYLGHASVMPTGWLLCAGDAVSRTTYATLFGVIGTRFGAGDGSTTFTLPNLQGHMLVGSAAMISTATGTASQTGTGDAYANATWDHNHSHSHVTNPAATTSGTPSLTVTSLTQTGAGTAGASNHTHSTDIAATTSDTDSTAMSVSPTQKRTRVNYIIKW